MSRLLRGAVPHRLDWAQSSVGAEAHFPLPRNHRSQRIGCVRACVGAGHCAGLRMTQNLGDYCLAHAYVREDHVLDQDLPLWVPLPAIAEVRGRCGFREQGATRDLRAAAQLA